MIPNTNNNLNYSPHLQLQTKTVVENEFGAKLSINPNLPPNTDYTGGQMMETPNSFKCGNTPTTPFNLGHGFGFPTNIFNLGSIANFVTTPVGPADVAATAEELLNFMPKTPLIPHQLNSLRNFGYANMNFQNFNPVGMAPSQQIHQMQQHQQYQQQLEYPQEKRPLEAQAPADSRNNLARASPKLPLPSALSQPVSKSQLNKALETKHEFNVTEDIDSDDSESGRGNKRKSSGKTKRGRDSLKDESRWKSWTREEEVFLVGAVMDRFFKRGSLSSTRADEVASDDSWSVIKHYYEIAWKNYYLISGISIPTDRPANALSRHYKVMKARISQADMNGEATENFRTYFEEWENKYNVGNRLVSELSCGQRTSSAGPEDLNSASADRDFSKRKIRLSVTNSGQNNQGMTYLQ